VFLTGKVFSLRAEKVHELVKQVLKIELHFDEDNDGYKAKETTVRAFIVRIDREEREGY
jgi:hypothetical protein